MNRIKFQKLSKLDPGDRVAIISPSFAGPGKWPAVYQLGLSRIKEEFGLIPVEYPSTSKLGASFEEKSKDIISAFSDSEIKAVISTIGGDDQIAYIEKYLTPHREIFINNPKPFFGYSDNTQLINFLWLNGVASYYGGCVFTEFAMNGSMDLFTVDYLKKAFFESGRVSLTASQTFNDEGLNWNDDSNLSKKRRHQINEGWYWDGNLVSEGIIWGGCIESIDDLLRNNRQIPTLEQFEDIVLIAESSEEMPTADYVSRVFRALGERGIIERLKAVLVGRPKAWDYDRPNNDKQKAEYKKQQREYILNTIRVYNQTIPVVQNLDFGHTAPQIPMPIGRTAKIDPVTKQISIDF